MSQGAPRSPMRDKRSARTIRLSCDRLFSLIVRAPGRCEKCGKTDGKLDAHHIYGRALGGYRLRHDLRNGCCLCWKCHHWAENAPLDFTDWFWGWRPYDAMYLAAEFKKGPLKRTTADYRALERELKARLCATNS